RPPRSPPFPYTTLFRSPSVAHLLRRFVPATEGTEEFIEWGTECVSESVPGLEGADRTTLLDLDESPSGQATPGSQLVVRPSPRRDRKSTRLNSSHDQIS